MKKLIMTMALCLSFAANVDAQDVYKEILRLARETADDKSKDLQTRKIATFKVDALEYMLRATSEMMPDSMMTDVINRQAYSLYDFISTFQTVYNYKSSPKEKQDVIDMYREASLRHPRFNDPDTDLTQIYINTSGYITRFSIDTDWVLALDDVKRTLKKTL